MLKFEIELTEKEYFNLVTKNSLDIRDKFWSCKTIIPVINKK